MSDDDQKEFEKTTLRLKEWTGEPLLDNYNKPVIDYDGKPLFAELVIVKMWTKMGWNAVWIDNFRKVFWTSLKNQRSLNKLPKNKLKILQDIAGKKSMSGCWDVFAWKDNKINFLECKRIGKDKIRQSQVDWYKKALQLGVPQSSFKIVEWEFIKNN